MPASFEYAEHKRLRCTGDADMGSGGDTYKVALLMRGTSAGAEPLIALIGSFSALLEFDDGAYVRGTLGSQTLTVDPTTAEAVFDAADQAFGVLDGDGSDLVIAALIILDNGALIPAFYIDRSPAFDPGSTDPYTLRWNADGIFRC